MPQEKSEKTSPDLTADSTKGGWFMSVRTSFCRTLRSTLGQLPSWGCMGIERFAWFRVEV